MRQLEGYKVENFDFADFYKVSDLIFFEGPILSHYINNNGENFLFHWADLEGDINRWLCFRVSLINIHEYLERKISLYDLLYVKSEKVIYVIDVDQDLKVISAIITERDKISEEYMPSKRSYYSFNPKVSNDIDEYYLGVNESGILQAIFQSNNRIGYGTIPMDILSPALHHLNEINNGLGQAYYTEKNKNRPEIGYGRRVPKLPKEEIITQTQFEVAGTGVGSFKLFLRPIVSQKTIGKEPTETDNYFNFFTNFIESSFIYENLLRIVSTLPDEVITHYEKLLKNIEVNGFDFQLKWSNPSTNQGNKILIEKKRVSIALDNINRLEYENAEEMKLVGRFMEINLLTKHYTFIQDRGDEKVESKGYFDELLKDGIILVQFNKLYEVTIFRKEFKQAGDKRPVVKDTLRAFYMR
jgi:hypothetical protein